MKISVFAVGLLSAVVLLPDAAYAQPTEQCRQIGNRKERHDCYARQDAAKAAPKTNAKPSKMDNDLNRLKRESDMMNWKLRSICKGC